MNADFVPRSSGLIKVSLDGVNGMSHLSNESSLIGRADVEWRHFDGTQHRERLRFGFKGNDNQVTRDVRRAQGRNLDDVDDHVIEKKIEMLHVET